MIDRRLAESVGWLLGAFAGVMLVVLAIFVPLSPATDLPTAPSLWLLHHFDALIFVSGLVGLSFAAGGVRLARRAVDAVAQEGSA